MGQRKSKPSKTSYDVAPVVSERDFKFESNQNNNDKKNGRDNGNINKPDVEPSIASSTTMQSNNQTEAQKDAAEKTFDPKLIPAWLKAELFADILKENLTDFERIVEFKAYPALSAGENYATLMLRVSIDAELKDKTTKNISFMLKVAHDNEQMRQMLKVANFFVTENTMYLDIVPELEQMYKDVGVDITLAAKAYTFPEEADSNSVLLQDLRPMGFKNANRRECLDLEHAHWVLKKLAQYHAASATRVATKGPYPDKIMKAVFEDKDKAVAIWDAMMATFKENFLKNVKHFKNGDKYEKQIAACLSNLTKELVQLGDYDENEFNALSHGDCWTNNILFKYNEAGEVVDMMFVDYQMSKYDSVAHDLWYFILSSLKLDIKLNKFEYLIRYYYDNLIESLQLLKYPKKLPALREIYMQLFKYGTWTIFTAIVILPVVLLDPTDTATMENFMATDADGQAFKNALYSNKRYHEHINEMLPWLHERGMLEVYDYSKPASVVKTETQAIEENSASPPATFKCPDWVNENIFADVLKQHFKDFKAIKDFKTSAATSGGDNYASTMVKVDIDFELTNGETKNASYMLKIALDDEQSKAMLAMMNTFNKEIAMYNEFIPKFEALYKAKGLDLVFAPKSFELPEKSIENVVLLENMRPTGFKNADRLAGLDETHTQAVLAKLAQFHAASACYALEHTLPSAITKSLYNVDSRPFFMKMKELFTPLFFESAETFEHKSEYLDKLKAINNVHFDVMIETAKPDENGFNVLNHGDVWTNNILFKYADNGKIEETYLIDYQIVNYGSPAYDLYYFLMSSPQLDIKVDKFDHHIKYYHDHLVEHLKLLEYPKHIPTLKELHEDLLRRGAFAYSVTVGVMAAVLLDPTELANMENLLSDADVGLKFRKLMYTNKRYKAHADMLFQWMNYRGILDYAECENTAITENVVSPPTFKSPEWVTDEIFDVLKQHFDDFKAIKDFKTSAATSGGDNYASTMVKVDIGFEPVHGEMRNVSYMLKVALDNEQSNAMLDMLNTFDKEIAMYNEYIPQFQSLYKQAGVDVVFAPKSFELQEKPIKNVVLLENLRPAGFKNADRLAGLDEKHTQAVLAKLAQFHAVSACYALEQSFPQVIKESMFREEVRPFFTKMKDLFSTLFFECAETFEHQAEYFEKLKKFNEVYMDVMQKTAEPDENGFNVLNHGDVWTNNILFKYAENGEIETTYLIDYQIVHYGSPAYDLYYFLMSSPKLDIKVHKFDHHIKYYHDNLVENLKLLKYPKHIPTLKELHEELLNRGAFGFSTTMGVMSAVLLDPTELANMDNMLSEADIGTALRKQMYDNKRFRAHADAILVWLNYRGLLDYDIADETNASTDWITPIFEVPNWINASYFEDVLKQHVDGFVNITNFKAEVATKAGDNYASIVLKIDVEAILKDGSKKEFSYILKTPPKGEQATFLLETWNSFKKEIELYQHIIPEFESMYEKVGKTLKFAPAYYKFKKEADNDVVLLENLKPRGFQNVDRLQGLNLEQTKSVLQKLAQFHAASAKFVENGGMYAEYFNEGMYNERAREMFIQIMRGTNSTILESIKTYEGHEEYYEKIPHLLDIFLDRAIALNKVDVNDFNVLNHADCWVNNILFQYDETGSLKETFLIDFQDCKYGAPATDLYYFLISSVQSDIKIEKFDFLIKYYHDNLVEHLELLKYKGNVPTLKELHESLIKYGFYGVSAIFGVTSLCLLDPTENISIDAVFEENDASNEIRTNMYCNPRYKAQAEKILLWLNRRGSLDF